MKRRNGMLVSPPRRLETSLLCRNVCHPNLIRNQWKTFHQTQWELNWSTSIFLAPLEMFERHVAGWQGSCLMWIVPTEILQCRARVAPAALHSTSASSLGKTSTPTSPRKEAGMRDRGKKLAAALMMLTGKNSDIARKVLPNIAQYLSHKNK